jgi:hypothetical protein
MATITTLNPTDAGDVSRGVINTNFSNLNTDLTAVEAVVNNASSVAPASIDLAEDTDNGVNKITITAPSAVASDKVLTLPDETGTFLSTVSTLAGINKTPLFAPRGFLINGKIAVTDAAGITIAIKTLAGSNPSTSDPVYIRIGDTIRSITSALSVSLADGTNWMNAGSAELATKEIDYFAYLVWDSNSSAVALSFARIPGANLVSDFSATTTNEKYCAGYSGFTTTDEVENIGRFAATLSAGAGYTWSVPTFTANNLIQRPIFETRDLSFIVHLRNSADNADLTATVAVSKYKLIGNLLINAVAASAISNPSGSAIICIPVFGGKDGNNLVVGAGYITDGVTNQMGYVLESSTSRLVFTRNGTGAWGASNNTLNMTYQYFI